MALRILSGRLADVASQETVFDEAGYRRLHWKLTVPVSQPFGGAQGGLKRLWRDQKPETQSRQHHLGERSNVDDAARAIERLKWVEGAALEPELAVIIVFDHDDVAPLCPLEQCHTTAERHRRAERELMGRRHADKARRLRNHGDVDSLIIDRYADDPRPQRPAIGTPSSPTVGRSPRAASARTAGVSPGRSRRAC